MSSYLCKDCKYNNNGWCTARRRNKLKEIYECDLKRIDIEESNDDLSKYSTDDLLEEIKRRISRV